MARQHSNSVCPYCGKNTYISRKSAKIAMRRAHPGDKMSIYKCRRVPSNEADRWHFGHLAPIIKKGVVDRSTAYSGAYGPLTDKTDKADKKDVLTMPSIAEIAHIKQSSQMRSAPEPTAPALVQAQFAYGALAEHVKNPLNGFERYNKDGIDGWIGPLAMKPFIEDLIPPKADWNSHQKHSRTRAVSEMLNRHKVAICIDHSGKLQGVKPTYFVAADGSVLDRLVPGKIIDPPAESSTPVKDQVKRSTRTRKSGAYTRGYEVLHKSVTKILKNAYDNHQIAVLGHELYDLADFSGIEDTGREKPSQGGFYTWMRERASRGEFSHRMETDAEFNARPNTQGGRKTYYYAPRGVEVPSMTHGETLAVYMAEAFPPAETPPATSPETEAMAAAVFNNALNIKQNVVEAEIATPVPSQDPRSKVISHLAEDIQTMNDFGLADHAGMDSAIHHLAQALAALTNG